MYLYKTYYEYLFPLFLLVYKKRLNCSQVLLDMEWKLKVKVDWKNVNGAAEKKRRLHLVTAEDGLFHCPVKNCDHDGFITQRGCKKHVKS